MVETDSPYLTPVPHRGQRNRPALVPLIGQAVAAVRELSVEDVARSTTATARKFFGLPQPSERVAAEDGEFL
jgi:TatD DNase family protein